LAQAVETNPQEAGGDNSPALTDWIIAALTAALVGVTIWYAIQTRATVDQMKLARADDVANRRREKSDRAAHHSVVFLQNLSDSMSRRGPSAVEADLLIEARSALEADGPLVDDALVREHMAACAAVLFVGAWTSARMTSEGLSPGRVSLASQEIVRATRFVLEAYLAERTPEADLWSRSGTDGGGDRLPTAMDALAWVHRVAGT
jgi:hypothetical protein